MSDAEDEVVFLFVKKCVDEHGRGGGGSGTANYEALGSRLRSSSTVEAAVVRRVLLALARCAPALVSGADADGSTDGGTGGGVAGCCAPGHVAGGRYVVAWARHRSLLEAALSFGARAGTAPPAAVRAFGEFLSQVKRVPPRKICERRAVAAPCAVCPRSNLSPLDRPLLVAASRELVSANSTVLPLCLDALAQALKSVSMQVDMPESPPSGTAAKAATKGDDAAAAAAAEEPAAEEPPTVAAACAALAEAAERRTIVLDALRSVVELCPLGLPEVSCRVSYIEHRQSDLSGASERREETGKKQGRNMVARRASARGADEAARAVARGRVVGEGGFVARGDGPRTNRVPPSALRRVGRRGSAKTSPTPAYLPCV